MYEDHGSILKLPGLFGKPDMVFTFDPRDSEIIFRNDGQWPIRRGIDTFTYYSTEVRPDIFKKGAGLVSDQGETWAKLRTAANPIMMKPKVVKAYIPDIDTVARDFIRKIRTLRDEKSEMPDDFQNELNKWSLESIALIALEHRLGLITRENDPENQKFINVGRGSVIILTRTVMDNFICRLLEIFLYCHMNWTSGHPFGSIIKHRNSTD